MAIGDPPAPDARTHALARTITRAARCVPAHSRHAGARARARAGRGNGCTRAHAWCCSDAALGQDCEELKEDLDEDEYESTKQDTISQLREFEASLQKMMAGDMTLDSELGAEVHVCVAQEASVAPLPPSPPRPATKALAC